ncbi:hypothetical protein A3F55_01325 [Candidatus Adlerbacteria bacterium RIFCSPHIGHO2_12_FULL_53_18]|uniref:RNA polymerase alpha subunit C-terminal domain-containing protein n=2 Tax=Parcubacteria group TaxID=1794811 RepID=A0A1F4XTF7_9BACT|nr:MAG: hypothetical protein A3F55_01325 [Candidatus Adlerbacteria bacterium RIFCSPHIGHO2_12_FULL_53_18]OGG51189.1 MAG: hypothetical protein A2704_03930 [Candidatus Kaiserbacteria bacterium RIFCSPHIGHO2_01_FULL_54_36b]
MVDRETREVIAARQKPPHKFHELPIWVLDSVPLWILAALYRGGVHKLGDLVRYTETELLRTPGFVGEVGKTTIGSDQVEQIRKGLAKFGQTLWEPTR